ncbi:methylenetetrahydrofolate reductase [Methylomonas sp. OY6]|uniref:Methylenetetrahydrofolate reductase n=1 Tax=Methylomonas defluvii TaxID=3045149 RepID=A0ABU4UBQ4_9GAMM|nr:methylenetetrahydrofolate reductase [Methylomonas sp. OY6]MDX8126858.1 methylenetetrahydrofolate reductase [Methylomonas sp. OY6]
MSDTIHTAADIHKIDEKTQLQALLSGFSIEITTKEATRIDNFGDFLPIGTEVYIVATPSTKPNDVVDLAKRLRDEEMIPVPHVAARAIPSIEILDRWLRRLSLEANVTAALIIAGGNYDNPVGSLASSMDLVKSGVLEGNGIADLRFAGHPEGHPVVDNPRLMNVLLEKQSYCAQKRFTTSLVTQFFFDFAAVCEWERLLIRSGVHMPIRVGFHGIASLSSLIRQARYCGVGASIEVLVKQPSKMLRTASSRSPERLIHSLAKHSLASEKTLFAGCHFFPLGNFEKTAEWVSAIVGGDIALC